jgi:hypothetical protein
LSRNPASAIDPSATTEVGSIITKNSPRRDQADELPADDGIAMLREEDGNVRRGESRGWRRYETG